MTNTDAPRDAGPDSKHGPAGGGSGGGVVPPPVEPTPDEAAGIRWWNALTEAERAHWLRIAGSARPADAWEAFKRARRDAEVR